MIFPRAKHRRLVGAMRGLALACAATVFITSTMATTAAGPTWFADAKTGCKLWSTDRGAAETVTWTGSCRNGVASGRGIAQWFDNGKATDRYDGVVLNGKAQGYGVARWANGNRYEGEWADGWRSGHGVWTGADGNRYDGTFVDDKPSGHGVYAWPDGRRYDGEFLKGLPNGFGTVALPDGRTYSGVWKDGCFRADVTIEIGTTKEKCGF